MPVTDWVTVAEATAIAGVTFTVAELENAADDVWSFIRWEPVFGTNLTGDAMLVTMQRSAIRQAIAWQAVHRKNNPPASADASISSESIGEYSVSYATPTGGQIIGGRARDALASAGLMRRVGTTNRFGSRYSELDD